MTNFKEHLCPPLVASSSTNFQKYRNLIWDYTGTSNFEKIREIIRNVCMTYCDFEPDMFPLLSYYGYHTSQTIHWHDFSVPSPYFPITGVAMVITGHKAAGKWGVVHDAVLTIDGNELFSWALRTADEIPSYYSTLLIYDMDEWEGCYIGSDDTSEIFARTAYLYMGDYIDISPGSYDFDLELIFRTDANYEGTIDEAHIYLLANSNHKFSYSYNSVY